MHWDDPNEWNDDSRGYYYHPRYPDALTQEELGRLSMKAKITKLNIAVKRADMGDVQTVLASGIDVNKRGSDGRTCIMSATFKWRPNILPLFLTMNGVDLNVRDKLGHSALTLAASSNNVEGARMLTTCSHDFDINIADRKGKTPLHYAISKCGMEMITILLDAGADPNHADKDGVSPFMLSCKFNSVPVLQALIASNANVNSVDARGRTPAIWCCRQGSADKLEELLRQEVDLNARDHVDDMSAFSQAVWKDQTKCAIMIMESPLCPCLLRSREPEIASGIVWTYWEVARSRKNIQLQNCLYDHMKNQIIACLLKYKNKIKLSVDLLEIIATYAV